MISANVSKNSFPNKSQKVAFGKQIARNLRVNDLLSLLYVQMHWHKRRNQVRTDIHLRLSRNRSKNPVTLKFNKYMA